MLALFLYGSIIGNGGAYLSQAPIIIDTDIMTDVDDVGALAVANVLQNCGLADIHGIAINTNSQYGSLATSVSNSLSASENSLAYS